MSESSKLASCAAAVIVLALACAPSLAQQLDERDIGVRVQQDGERIIVDVTLPVAATAIEAWNVLTDYDHMAGFVSNLQSSRILEREGDAVTIEQKGKATRGL